MTNGTLTLVDALFQEAYIRALAGDAPTDYNSRPEGPDLQAELIPCSFAITEGFLFRFLSSA